MEHGRGGKPSRRLVHRVCQFLGIIWDEAEELQHLADLSHPRVVVDTAGLSVKATLFANLLAGRIAGMDEETFDRLLREIENEIGRAHVCTPVTNAHLVCRLPLEKINIYTHNYKQMTPKSTNSPKP